MTKTVSISKTFKKMKKHFDEQKDLFHQYSQKVNEILCVNREIVEYIKEHCNIKDCYKLNEMERDHRIFAYRFNYLSKKVSECVKYFADGEKYYSIKSNIEGLHYENCLNAFMSMYDVKRDIQFQLQKAQKKWENIQNSYLKK